MEGFDGAAPGLGGRGRTGLVLKSVALMLIHHMDKSLAQKAARDAVIVHSQTTG